MERLNHSSERLDQSDLKSIIEARQLGDISTDDMLDVLVGHEFTAGEYDPTGGDGFIRGDWAVIEDGLLQGQLTNDEYEYIATKASGAEASD